MQPSRSQTSNFGRSGSRRGSGSGYDDGDSEGAYDSDSQDGLSFTDDQVPITGFAVASMKRNSDFHELFPEVTEGDYLIEGAFLLLRFFVLKLTKHFSDYGCALQREILIQGRLYISENHMCFHANIFGWVTNVRVSTSIPFAFTNFSIQLVVPFSAVTNIEKKMTAFVIPNAIMISTHDAKHTFASFLSRDTTFDVMGNIWKLAHPGGPPSTFSGNRSDAGSSMLDVPGLAGSTIASDAASAVPSTNGGPIPSVNGVGSPGSVSNHKKAQHKPTVCACSLKKEHYPELAMECVLPGTPEKIYNLLFASGFIKNFMVVNQKLTGA